MHITRPPEYEEDAEVEIDSSMTETTSTENIVYLEDTPSDHIPTQPARWKAAAAAVISTPADYGASIYQEIQAWLTDNLPFLGYFAAGGLAGITSRTATAPLDRLKVYLIAQTGGASEALAAARRGAPLQATKHGMSTMWNACKEIWADGGIRSLFAGMFTSHRSVWHRYLADIP